MKNLAPPPSDVATAPARPDVGVLLDVLAELVADRIAARLGRVEPPRHYTRSNLPPGAKSWRAARETAAREGIEVVRAGRDVLIVASSWDEYLARRTSRRGPVEIRSADEAALAKMGVQLRGLPGGRR